MGSARPSFLARRDPNSDALASVEELDDARMGGTPTGGGLLQASGVVASLG
jgi:hypothetical protein